MGGGGNGGFPRGSSEIFFFTLNSLLKFTCVWFEYFTGQRLSHQIVLQETHGLLRTFDRRYGPFLPCEHDLTARVGIYKHNSHLVKKTKHFLMNLDIIIHSLRECVCVFYLQLPNLRGQEWPSMGKSISLMGHSALIVSLTARTRVRITFDGHKTKP